MQPVESGSSVLDYARIPPRLKDLLRREACLLSSKEQLDTALVEFSEQHREVETTRPPFLFLRKNTVKQQFAQRLSETRQTIDALQKGSAKLTELLPRLHTWITDEIERYLIAENTTFLHGLSRHRFAGDWARILHRIETLCREFSESAARLHQALCALQPEQRVAGQLHIIDLVKVGRVWGGRVDLEIGVLNRIAECQRALAIDTPHIEIPQLGCETNVARVAMIDDFNSRDLLAKFIARFQSVSRDVIASSQQQAAFSASRSAGDLHSYVDAAWDALRSCAINEFNPAQMERLLIETERMLEKHEQA